jgi:hypothetical protein
MRSRTRRRKARVSRCSGTETARKQLPFINSLKYFFLDSILCFQNDFSFPFILFVLVNFLITPKFSKIMFTEIHKSSS